MMKRCYKAVGLVVALAMTLTVSSCSAAAPANNASNSDMPVSSVESAEVLTETALEAQVKEDTFQEQVKTLSESYEAQGMKLDITAEGNTLVYTCTYTVDGVDIEEARTALKNYLDSDTMTKSIEEVLESIRKSVPETESVKVVYVDNDGQEIASKEYK